MCAYSLNPLPEVNDSDIRVLVADRQPLVLQGARSCIEQSEGIVLVGEG